MGFVLCAFARTAVRLLRDFVIQTPPAPRPPIASRRCSETDVPGTSKVPGT
jgi:hypothetical protein